MIHKRLFRNALLLHCSFIPSRSIHAMATSAPVTPVIDRAIFNQTLYDQMRDFWFQGVPDNATSGSFEALQRWFAIGRSKQEKEAFDEECRTRFGPALEAISPSKLALPPWKSYEDELQHAETLAAPLLAQVKEAQREDAEKGAKTLLSQILLLDQMPRNTMRDQAGLKLVYSHYDRLAFSLLRSSMRLSPHPFDAKLWRGAPVYLTWALLPLMHSEHLPSHDLYTQRMAACRKECEATGDEAAIGYIDRSTKFEADHVILIERFGRYPHRNQCQGRQNTAEEEVYLKTADTFGVENNHKEEVGRSEL